MRNEMEKIKIIVPFYSVPTQRGIQNAKKKAKKLKNTITHHFKPKQFEKGHEREKLKIIVSIRCNLTRYRKFEKNRKKIEKKIPLWLHFKPKSVESG